MTADNKFAARLRELSRNAAPAPWSDSHPENHIRFRHAGQSVDDALVDWYDDGYCLSPMNSALVVALRNHADRLADLVERVAQYRAALESVNALPPGAALVDWSKARSDYVIANVAMLAALDALDGGGA